MIAVRTSFWIGNVSVALTVAIGKARVRLGDVLRHFLDAGSSVRIKITVSFFNSLLCFVLIGRKTDQIVLPDYIGIVWD